MGNNMKRRNFIKSLSLLMAPFSVASGIAKAGMKDLEAELNAELPLHLVIDRRYVNSAEQMPKLISKVDKLHCIDQGMSGDFLEPLLNSWDKKSITTVGITLSSEFFILKTLAKEKGYRVDVESQYTKIPKHDDLIMWTLIPDNTLSTNV